MLRCSHLNWTLFDGQVAEVIHPGRKTFISMPLLELYQKVLFRCVSSEVVRGIANIMILLNEK